MTEAWTFVALLALTLVFLGGVVWTGLRARRRLHLPLVACAVASLGVTIWAAERLGSTLDLESAGWIFPVHVSIAKVATAAYALPLATGIATLKRPGMRRRHRIAAFATLLLTVLTAVTGTWMVLAADPLP